METPVNLVFQEISNTSDYYLSIIKRNGKHITTYPISDVQFEGIVMENKLWVQKTSKGFESEL